MNAPHLVVTAGPDKGASYALEQGKAMQVGRSAATVTRLTDGTVSRVHCEVEWDGTRTTLINLSTGGTQVNGEAVSQRELQPGDVIRLGSTEMRYQLSAPEAATTERVAPRRGAALAASLLGQTLAHYALEAIAGQGNTGVVFKARDTRNGQVVALKVLQPEFGQHEEGVHRFVRAMKTMLPLRHDNLVPLLGAGKTGVYCWAAMEFIDGESMTQVIHRLGVAGRLDWRYGYRVAVHVARALEYAHGRSVIHRNLTPQNILMRTSDKRVLLGDLMLAKALEGTLAKDITRPGELVGDLTYMAAERTHESGVVDGRSDLYGLGATVYALIAGRPPFAGGTPVEMVQQIRRQVPERPTKFQMSIPGQFEGVVMKLLAKRPEDRYQSATDLLGELERVGRSNGASA